jgi:Flp pilus assembly protein TadB
LIFIDDKLKNNGRPFGLTAVKYILFKFIFSLIAIVPLLLIHGKVIIILIFFICGFFILDLVLVIDSRDNKKRIELDMPNIINNLFMQLEANVPFVDCLNTLHMSAENSKLLKEGLKEFNIRFTMNDFDIDAACNDLEKSFSNVTLSTLLMAFRQYKDSGKMKDILKRQYELHLKKEEEAIENSSNSIIKTAAVSTVLIAINCVLMIVYPMYISMNENMYSILK